MHTCRYWLILAIAVTMMHPYSAYSQDVSKQTVSEPESEIIVDTEEKILSGLTEEENEWYERFKEGVLFLDGWNEISDNILDIFPEDMAAEKELFIRMLGLKIGSEWCRKNEERKIDTRMLKEWGEKIRNAVAMGPETTEKILREIDSEVDLLLEKSDRKSLFSPQS